ncbi:hypothetical protein [Ilumatobacter sp.]|uniref:hypothetical protein n=1 Tax=Ilumatobacter sp. TaxID=1967498 RepID=UPI003AF9B713
MSERLDEEAVQRVVRRAVELDDTSDPVTGGVAPEALVEAAAELGIAPEAINESLAIERLGPEPDPARLDRLVGPRSVVVERTVSYPGVEAFERLDEWFTTGHHLRREYGDGSSGEWRKRGDLVGGVQRRARSIGGGAALGSVRLIVARVSQVDEEHAVVRLTADRTVARRATAGTAGLTSAGALTTAVIVAAPAAAVAIPGLAVAGAISVASKHGSIKVQRELVRLLDQIESGRRPGTLGRGLRRRLGGSADRS